MRIQLKIQTSGLPKQDVKWGWCAESSLVTSPRWTAQWCIWLSLGQPLSLPWTGGQIWITVVLGHKCEYSRWGNQKHVSSSVQNTTPCNHDMMIKILKKHILCSTFVSVLLNVWYIIPINRYLFWGHPAILILLPSRFGTLCNFSFDMCLTDYRLLTVSGFLSIVMTLIIK